MGHLPAKANYTRDIELLNGIHCKTLALTIEDAGRYEEWSRCKCPLGRYVRTACKRPIASPLAPARTPEVDHSFYIELRLRRM
jgi:hypothetical protein